MPARTRSLWVDEEGVAFAEALVTLPFFAAALAGIVALNGTYGAKFEAKARARRIAWLQAESGDCPATSCGSECARIESDIQTRGLSDALRVTEGGRSGSSLLREVGEYLLGGTTVGIGTARARKPGLLGGGMISQHAANPMLCNTRARVTEEGDTALALACESDLRSVRYAQGVCE
ncbi:MAG: hypothetical protein WBG86_10850 [Polyangiales bacterium]